MTASWRIIVARAPAAKKDIHAQTYFAYSELASALSMRPPLIYRRRGHFMLPIEDPALPLMNSRVSEIPRSRVAQSAGIISLAVMASRVLGLIRDQVFAIFFGAGFHYDAFLTAFRIPNLLRDLFAEGALSSAFVTTFTQVLDRKGGDEARRLSNRVATMMIIIIGAISVFAWFEARTIVGALAPGFFSIPGKAELATELTRVMIPFLLFVALAAQAMGILNAHNRFAVPALASAFFNLGSIMGGLLLGFVLGPYLGISPIAGMAYGTLLGGFLQFAVQWPSLRKIGFSYRPMLSFTDPGVRQIIGLMGPAVIGTAAVQINVFVNTNFASSIIDPATGMVANGPVSWLNYAFRFMQFPIGVFGVAVATAALPQLSRDSARAEYEEFRRTLAHALILIFVLCIPSAVGLVVLGRPIIALIFEHGRFNAFDTVQTGNALAAYAVGLTGYAAVKVLSPAFYAVGAARTPMLISLGSIAVNYILNLLLVGPFGHVGLAASTSGVALVNFVLLAAFMRRKLGGIAGRELTSKALRIAAASVPMALAAWLASELAALLPVSGLSLHLARVTFALALAAVAFFYACRMLHVNELDEAINAVGGRVLRRLRRT
jgi:putative peptidoglycan lipid II flippase